eukprot:441857_1
MAEHHGAPLLANTSEPTGQPIVIAQQPQQIIYTQPSQQLTQYQQPQYVQAPVQQQVIYQQQPAQYQPQNQQPVQYIQQPIQSQPQPQPQSQYQPTDQQLGEGLDQPILVTKPSDPIHVEGSKDGIGMVEGCQRNPHLLTWILTIIIWFMLFSVSICNIINSNATDGYCSFFSGNIGIALGITGGIAIAYWIECFCAGTGKYLNHILQNEGAEQFVERIKTQPAEIWWRVACYHFETRRKSRQVTDSNGNTRTEWETYQEKVYTWRAKDQYRYNICIDVSGQLLGLNEYNLTKLKLRKTYGFVDSNSQQQYILQRRTFRMMNWRDMHQEFYEEFTIPGYVDRILAESEPGIKPGWMSVGFYWLCSIMFFSPCFRHKMSAACGNVEYTFIKQLSAN